MKKTLKTLLLLTPIILSGCNSKPLKNEISQSDWNDYRQYIELSTGLKMSYVEMGKADGQPIVLQHGMTDNSRSWSLAAPYFAKAGYHVYIPDLRGQGHSQEMDGHYTTFTYATDLNAFFEAKKIDKAICVGHSLGSFTMQTFWSMFPQRVEKCVLVSSIPLLGYQAQGLAYVYENKIAPLPEGGHLDDAFMDFWYDCTKEPVEKEIKDNGEFDKFISYMKKEAQVLSKKSWTNVIMGMLESNFCGNDETVNTYKYMDKSKQCLILHGETDSMTKGVYQDELIELLSNETKTNVTYREYVGVGHNIQFVTPNRCATDILGWLQTGKLPEIN